MTGNPTDKKPNFDASEKDTGLSSGIAPPTDKLRNDLEAAVKLTIEDLPEDPAGEPNLPREQAAKSLAAVLEFLTNADFDIRLKQPLSKLFAALADADAGKHSDLLAPRTISNRPPKPILDNAVFATASAVVTVMIGREGRRTPKTLDTATRTVARVLEAAGFTTGSPGTPSGSALKYFRDRIGDKDRNDPARLVYEDFLSIPGIREYSDDALLSKLEALSNLKSHKPPR